MSSRNARCVFVGNIPYGATEEQLTEVFSGVGPVVSFRLVFDRDTGKPKGYGFCEFRDADTAMCALRNLDGFELNGRVLRVDVAENEKTMGGGGGAGGGPPDKRPVGGPPPGVAPGIAAGRGPMPPTGGGSILGGPMPRGVPPPAGVTPEAQISSVLEGMGAHQLYEVVAQMKVLVEQNPEQAKQILATNPQFSFALLQAQVVLGMIRPQLAQHILATATGGSGVGLPPAVLGGPSSSMMGPPPLQPPTTTPVGPVGGPPSFHVPPPTPAAAPPFTHLQPPPSFPMPAIPSVAASSSSVSAPVMPSAAAAPSSLDQQRALLQQLMQLTPQQLESLPPLQRQQIQELQYKLKSVQLPAGGPI
ncbi:cleavage stimulating factor 64 [Balamuthia mandrillaris]